MKFRRRREEMLIIFLGVILVVAFITLFERKLMGAIQRRIGPNKVGILGILQPIMDGIKLIQKESIFPSHSNSYLFIQAPFITFYLALANWLFLPLSANGLLISEIPGGGILLIIALTELGIFGIFYSGWSANSKYPLIGSIRSTAQMISYSISLSLIILSSIFIIQDLSQIQFLNSTTDDLRKYTLFPLIPLFIISAQAEVNRSPFDLPEAESEQVAGFFTEHSAVGFVFFFLGEYTSILTISTQFSIQFLGSSFIGTFILQFIVLWVRAILPRLRFDQLQTLGWTQLLPFTIAYVALFLPSFLFSFDLI